ncbi:nuclear transport factor 2 family protein [Actinophytocola algeriensis]|uniref:Ketosteroid isomerase-like protein n=1 Tax=Actinophytocola algeriensis TaxID=1768010 RepID=A0A7W7Q9C0_9PSEU|nr:nuclear transport factor 2 family protein [Actinophytocola algeriensis]MBB4909288.1 ketosteroid isomerase-like protein [Actinophytocola algeriensis]MBE1475278.1 ketosteroid isomerase-like protein [Actinophytocola algeriensis]
MTTFRAAIEARDLSAAEALLADDVVFRSPVAHRPYPGKPITAAILRAVVEVLEDFRYVRELHDGADHVLMFEAKVEGLDITGCDILRYDEDGRIADFTVMVRPLRAAEALARQMGARFEQIQAQAVANS